MATREQITVQASNRRVNEEHDRFRRRVEAARDKVLREVERLEKRLLDDPIRVAGMRYSKSDGLASTPITIDTDMFKFTFDFVTSATGEEDLFEPKLYINGTATVRPLGLFVSQLGAIVPFAVENTEISYRIALNWVKERSPQESKVWLIDHESGEYYYPIDTDLRGEVVAGYPQIGLIAFEPFRRPTSRISVHFSNVKLSPQRGRNDSFEFVYSSPTISKHIASAIARGTILQAVEEKLESTVASALATIERQRQSLLRPIPRSGCLVLLVAWPAAAGVVLGLIRLVSGC